MEKKGRGGILAGVKCEMMVLGFREGEEVTWFVGKGGMGDMGI